MIRKYVILINEIRGMGGGQMYARNKVVYLKSLGWEPQIFYGIDGELMIPELRAYQGGYLPLLVSSPLVYNKQIVSQVLSCLREKIGACDQLVIESSSPHMALWGELLAESLEGKHMAHLLDERCDEIVPEGYLPFFRFKHKRRELSGIHENSLKLLFRGSQEITAKNAYALFSVCSNTVSEDVTDCELALPPKDNRIVLGCIGRREKPYVAAAARAFADVIRRHPESMFRVIFIGAAEDPAIQNLFGELPNAEVLMTGYIYPIPLSLMNYVDVFLSSAGSANISYRCGKVTISIDSVDTKAIGVMGYTTQNSVKRKDEPQMELDSLLEKVLYTDYLTHYPYAAAPKLDVEGILAGHLVFLEQSEKKSAYYPVLQMRAAGKDKTKRVLVRLLGAKGYVAVRPLLNRCQSAMGNRTWLKGNG